MRRKSFFWEGFLAPALCFICAVQDLVQLSFSCWLDTLSDSRCKAARGFFMVQRFLRQPASHRGLLRKSNPGLTWRALGSAALVSLPCTRGCCESLAWGTPGFGCRLSTSRCAVATGWVMWSREVALGNQEALAVRCRGPAGGGLCRQGWVLLLGSPGCCARAHSRRKSAVQGFPLHQHGFQCGAAVADPARAACGHAGCMTQGLMPRK